MQSSNSYREWGSFSKHRAIDRLSGWRYSCGRQKGEINFLFSVAIQCKIDRRIRIASNHSLQLAMPDKEIIDAL